MTEHKTNEGDRKTLAELIEFWDSQPPSNPMYSDRNEVRPRSKDKLYVGIAGSLIVDFQIRSQVFDAKVNENQLLILLDMYVARSKLSWLSVSSVCYGSGASSTTALRYIEALERYNYIKRKPSLEDGRVIKLILTQSAIVLVEEYLDKILDGKTLQMYRL